ncbi:hypothetical protein G5I_08631 [Acromyrmex echinatior]|uniref:Uncharacterized protein n=1 Tax=Acromyrmex echinatior TaxID=103372 RepID=F4WS21_ACREC|nr:hypothetical protein G5I_08631 [Acromyrmex echinatior]
MNQESSDEEILSDDSGCASDMSEYEMDRVEKFVSSPEIRTLNARTKHCVIHNYYTTGGSLTVCTSCMILERELLEQCNQVATLTECFSWLQQCDEYIKQLEELCRAKRPRLTIGYRQSAVARIARLAGAKLELERRFVHIGGEYARGGNERTLVWREIDAAFESHILTGAVINSNHIELRRFLEDAGDVVSSECETL